MLTSLGVFVVVSPEGEVHHSFVESWQILTIYYVRRLFEMTIYTEQVKILSDD